MKNIYITLAILIAFYSHSYAQNKNTAKADNLFYSYQYTEAIEAYKQLLSNKKATDYIYKQLADSYYLVADMKNAAVYYDKINEKDKDEQSYYRHAQALKTQGEYTQAHKLMDKFVKLNPADQRALAYMQNKNYVAELKATEQSFELKKESLNLEHSSSYGASFGILNNIYFVSTYKGNKTDNWTGEPYLNIYQTSFANNAFTEPKPIPELNSKYHDGPLTINKEENIIFFTRDGHLQGNTLKSKKTNTKIGKLGIYRAEKKEGKWTNITPLPFNSSKYSVANPSLSQDGKTLYFASDMPGGMGDTDIWKVAIHSDGTYGKPINLGAHINSLGKENFPFINKDNVLYFASNGHLGLGGYDIFKADLTTNEKAKNLGAPINSKSDDFSFALNHAQNLALFSSNREGNDKIYLASPICKTENNIIVKNATTKQPLSKAKISLLDKNGKNTQSLYTKNDGTISFTTSCKAIPKIKVQLTNYQEQLVSLTAEKQTLVLLEPTPKDEVIITENQVILKPIFFEFNKSNITPQGALELDKLVSVMSKYPNMNILVKAHTDTKGNANYNLKLSQKRAKATVAYIIEKGIDKNRIDGKGMGEKEPKIDCGENCTDKENAQNRRSEFIIVK